MYTDNKDLGIYCHSLHKMIFYYNFYYSSQDVWTTKYIRASKEHEPWGGADGKVLLHGGHDMHGLLCGVVQTER